MVRVLVLKVLEVLEVVEVDVRVLVLKELETLELWQCQTVDDGRRARGPARSRRGAC